MNLAAELQQEQAQDLVVAGRLAIAYALFVMSPYTEGEISREGSPAEIAAWVIVSARRDGRMGFLRSALA